MKRDFDAASVAFPREQIELSLAQLEGSDAFRSAPRHRAMLRYMVERALAGESAALKETVIAVDVFRRPAARFDPKIDSIVRVEARRLRRRLGDYYRGEGRTAALRIELPVGSYVPFFAIPETDAAPDASARKAADLVSRGEHFLRAALSRQTLETALERFDEALRTAPPSARAFVGMARAWLNLATGWHHPPAVATEHAAEALRKALELDPDHAVAHTLLGAVQNQHERDWPAAQRSFRRALSLSPQDAFVHSAYGCHLFMRDLDADAERELLRARELDPLYVNSRAHLVNLRIRQGRLDDARAELDAMLDVAPDSLAARGLAGVLALARGDHERAIEIYDGLCRDLPDHPACLVSLAGAQAAAGRLEESDALLGVLRARFGDHIVSPYVLAICAAHARRIDLAFELLREADDTRDPSALYIPSDPSFAALHGDPRWPALAAAVAGRRRRPAQAARA